MSKPDVTSPCKRGCCWTPWSPEVCARRHTCNCHQVKTFDDLMPTQDAA